MKIYMKKLPKTCSTCDLGRRLETEENKKMPWYVCFPTGRVHTSITTERPEDCPAELEENEGQDGR